MNHKEITIKNLSGLPELAELILAHSKRYTIWGFYGALGAGKTTLIQEICRQIGVTGTVTSPTFALVNEYRGLKDKPIYHFDFYRIRNISEAYDIGYEEYFYSGNLCFVEWPEKIGELLPETMAGVRITRNEDDSRTVIIDLP